MTEPCPAGRREPDLAGAHARLVPGDDFDQASFDCVFPDRQARTRGAPRLHGFVVESPAGRDPSEQLEQQRMGRGGFDLHRNGLAAWTGRNASLRPTTTTVQLAAAQPTYAGSVSSDGPP